MCLRLPDKRLHFYIAVVAAGCFCSLCSEVSCRALPLCTLIRSHPPLAAVSSTSSPQPSAATRSYQRSQSTVVSVRPLSLQCSSGVFRLGDTLCISSPVGHFLHAGFCEVFPLRPLSQFCSAAVLWPGDTLCTCFTVGFVRSSFCLTAQLLSALSFRRESGLVQPTVHLRDFLRCLCAMWHRFACPGYTAQLLSAIHFLPSRSRLKVQRSYARRVLRMVWRVAAGCATAPSACPLPLTLCV